MSIQHVMSQLPVLCRVRPTSRFIMRVGTTTTPMEIKRDQHLVEARLDGKCLELQRSPPNFPGLQNLSLESSSLFSSLRSVFLNTVCSLSIDDIFLSTTSFQTIGVIAYIITTKRVNDVSLQDFVSLSACIQLGLNTPIKPPYSQHTNFMRTRKFLHYPASVFVIAFYTHSDFR